MNIFAKYFKHDRMSAFGALLCSNEGSSGNDVGSASGAPASSAAAPSGGGSDGNSGAPASSATPSSEPAPSPTAPAATPSSAPADPWAALGSADLDTHDDDAVVLPTTPPAVEPQAQPAAAPPPPPAAPTAPPQPTPQAPPQSATQAQPQPLPSPGEPEALAAAMMDPSNLPRILEHLAPRFALSEEEAAEFETNAVAALPKLAAKLHVEAVTASMKFLSQAFPQMLQKHEQVTKANNAAKDKFFKAFPALSASDPKHEQLATRMVSLYRAQNPQASMDEVIAQVGPMVVFSLGLQGQAAPAPQQPAHQPIPPTASAFRPAVGGGGGGPAEASQNPWAGMGQSYDDEG